MPALHWIFAGLLALTFCLATYLEPWQAGWLKKPTESDSLLSQVMGDSRRLFSNHFFIKADVYYHRGYYPSIFDQADSGGKTHMAADAGLQSEHGDEEGMDFLSKTPDWIDRFGRNFYPTTHVHAEHDAPGAQREMLPWLKLAASLDPQKVDTYTVASYWLRSTMGKVDDAENFLRQGLRANPNSYEILFELGRIYSENRHDTNHACNLWELALRRWNEQQALLPDPDIFTKQEILMRLALGEESRGNYAKAIEYMMEEKKNAPNPAPLEKQIQELKEKLSKATVKPSP